MGKSPGKGLTWFYALAVGVALFTGFGNMPLWGRYYIADIPGLGWTGNFYMNLQVHLFIGAVLLGLTVYALISYLYVRRDDVRLTLSGSIRAVLLILAQVSGVVMAARNLSGVRFPFELQVGLIFLHMGTAVTFMIASVACLIARCNWTQD